MIELNPSLRSVLNRLKLPGLSAKLPDHAAYANKAGLGSLDFLELVLQDEIDRREQKNLTTRLERAGFEDEHTFEAFDWEAPVTFDRDRVRDLFSLAFIERREDVIFLGPVGVGNTFLACALGHAACRAGHRVLFLRGRQPLNPEPGEGGTSQNGRETLINHRGLGVSGSWISGAM